MLEGSHVQEAWMVYPQSIAVITVLGFIIYLLKESRAYSTGWLEVAKGTLLFMGGAAIVLAGFGAALYILFGAIGFIVYHFAGIMNPQMILPTTVFQLAFIGSVLYGIPKWLILNWEKAKLGKKSKFKPLWK